jgi:hypothetical protein
MSTNAAAKQRTQDVEFPPPMIWMQKISSPDPNLALLNGVKFHITLSVASPTGQMTEFEGHTETSPPIPFLGYYNSGQLVSFSLTIDAVLYTFFGVISPTPNAPMAGVILKGGSTGGGGVLPDAPEDEGSWSSQAPPHEEEDDRRPRKPAGKKKRRA